MSKSGVQWDCCAQGAHAQNVTAVRCIITFCAVVRRSSSGRCSKYPGLICLGLCLRAVHVEALGWWGNAPATGLSWGGVKEQSG